YPHFFFTSTTARTEIYTLSLHDALPISFVKSIALTAVIPTSIRMATSKTKTIKGALLVLLKEGQVRCHTVTGRVFSGLRFGRLRSEEHTSELQSRGHLVCRLLLERKKT